MSCFANCIGRKKNKVYWANLNNSNGKKTWIDANGTQIFTLSQLCCVCVCVCGGGGGGGSRVDGFCGRPIRWRGRCGLREAAAVVGVGGGIRSGKAGG